MKKKSKVPAKFKKLVRDTINEYEKVLGIIQYEGRVYYPSEDMVHPDDSKTLASCSVDHRYLTADYRIFPMFVERWKSKFYTEEECKEKIAHEVAHLATHLLHWNAVCRYVTDSEMQDSWESLTELVGRLIYKASKK